MQPHSHQLRQQAIERWESGERMSLIAKELSVDYDTLRGWAKRYRAEGAEGLSTRYPNCGARPKHPPASKAKAVALKEAHRGWGAGYIGIQLAKAFPGSRPPSERQLQRWFAGAGLSEGRTRLPRQKAGWARRPFECVQADAKERLRTADGEECCYLTFTDERSGGVLDAFVFPLWPNMPSARGRGVRRRALPDVPLGLHQLFPCRQRGALR